MRLTLVISSLRTGGAERVMATLANAWVRRGDCVTLITLGSADIDFYPVDSRVRRIGLDLMKNSHGVLDKFHSFLRRVSALRQAVTASNPDAVISFINQMNLLTLLATRGQRCPVIVSERIDPREVTTTWGIRLLRRALYPRADAVVVQTQSVQAWARNEWPRCRTVVIPNPVAVPQTIWLPPGRPKVVAVGRLIKQKGFDVLIEAFARIAAGHPSWSLDIFGEGPERATLELLIQDLRLADKAVLRGVVTDINAPLVDAGLFVMSSRFEGFPNALLEAMACGCPVISTDCPSGPAEIIRAGHDGLLVPSENVTALADSMNRLMSSEADRRRLGSGASTVLERFGIDRILGLWDNLIQQPSVDQYLDDAAFDGNAKPTDSRRAA